MNSSRATPATLDEWLQYIDRVHPQGIAMGLERVAEVKARLQLAPQFTLIAVGGTNGKGSACAMLEAMLHHAGYNTGCYTSPHVARYNERVRIGRREVGDTDLVRAFEAVEQARTSNAGSSGQDSADSVRLTYFEFGTLAAVWLFMEARLDAAILEVGLGGRLDAVNAFDADCALVMSVALDHMDYLGDTREAIGYEKAGIFRAGRPAICGDPAPPQSLLRHAGEIGATLLVRGVDFDYAAERAQWRYRGPHRSRHGLPHPVLRGTHQLANASACIAALDALRERLPVTMDDIRSGLLEAETPGRFQVLPGRPAIILDVAHNPAAASALAATLGEMRSTGRTLAVFAMLRDKDIAGVVSAVNSRIDAWYVAGIDAPRGANGELLARILRERNVEKQIVVCESIADAYAQACDGATQNDRILVFGSFYTVSAAIQAREARRSTRQR
ncbi:MAG: bifunctional tetrahydrofolate synthase/dihydrofolate synthase [Betaproteobacteria bacterium]